MKNITETERVVGKTKTYFFAPYDTYSRVADVTYSRDNKEGSLTPDALEKTVTESQKTANRVRILSALSLGLVLATSAYQAIYGEMGAQFFVGATIAGVLGCFSYINGLKLAAETDVYRQTNNRLNNQKVYNSVKVEFVE